METKFKDGNNIFFTSDLHSYHQNILKYCHRPFKDVEEMNKKLIENWNSVITDKDVVFILGDVGFGSLTNVIDFIKQLKGKKVLIPGNHDRDFLKHDSFTSLFEHVAPMMYICVGKQPIYLSHFPFLCFDGSYKDTNPTWQLFGHCHSQKGSMGIDSLRLVHLFPTQYDVGVDNNNYYPIKYSQVEEIINTQQQSKWKRFVMAIYTYVAKSIWFKKIGEWIQN